MAIIFGLIKLYLFIGLVFATLTVVGTYDYLQKQVGELNKEYEVPTPVIYASMIGYMVLRWFKIFMSFIRDKRAEEK